MSVLGSVIEHHTQISSMPVGGIFRRNDSSVLTHSLEQKFDVLAFSMRQVRTRRKRLEISFTRNRTGFYISILFLCNPMLYDVLARRTNHIDALALFMYVKATLVAVMRGR